MHIGARALKMLADRWRIRPWAMALAALLAVAGPAAAQDGALDRPQGDVILTVEGAIGATNDGERAQFDRAMLESMGMKTIVTTTPWFDGAVTFEGVLMERLMARVKAQGEEVVVTALNDYQAPVPISDFAQYGVILALKRNGDYMPISDKGPLFIIYPYDAHTELHAQKYYARSVWQVRHFTIR